jgi:hypothetical protein
MSEMTGSLLAGYLVASNFKIINPLCNVRQSKMIKWGASGRDVA